MAGVTTGGLPYPTGTDRVMDGDNAIQALAEAVDPGTRSADSAVTNGPSTNAANTMVYRRGRWVLANVSVTATAALVPGGVLFVAPVGFRHTLGSIAVFGQLMDAMGGNTLWYRVHVDNTGNVSTQTNVPSGTVMRGQIIWPLSGNG